MEANSSHQMAIDLLMVHLGLSEEEAVEQLGMTPQNESTEQHVLDTHTALMATENK